MKQTNSSTYTQLKSLVRQAKNAANLASAHACLAERAMENAKNAAHSARFYAYRAQEKFKELKP